MLEQYLQNQYPSLQDSVVYAARGCTQRDFALSAYAIEPWPPRTTQVVQARSSLAMRFGIL